MTPTCYICGYKAKSRSDLLMFTENGDASRTPWYACANHGVSEHVEAWQRTKADRDYWPIELAHPYDEAAERLAAAEARANAQTATLVVGKTRARRVVHDLAPKVSDRDPTSVLDDDPCPRCMESGAHICDGERVDRWTPRFSGGLIRIARLDADGRPGPSVEVQGVSGMAMHHIDGNPRNNAPSNLALVPIRPISRGGMTDEDYDRFGIKA